MEQSLQQPTEIISRCHDVGAKRRHRVLRSPGQSRTGINSRIAPLQFGWLIQRLDRLLKLNVNLLFSGFFFDSPCQFFDVGTRVLGFRKLMRHRQQPDCACRDSADAIARLAAPKGVDRPVFLTKSFFILCLFFPCGDNRASRATRPPSYGGVLACSAIVAIVEKLIGIDQRPLYLSRMDK